MNKILSMAALVAASSAFGAGSCIICPSGYTCAGGTDAPVKVGELHLCPLGEFWNTQKILKYGNGTIMYEPGSNNTIPQTEAACDVCPQGMFCPVPGEAPLSAPIPAGSIITLANLEGEGYANDFVEGLGSDEKIAISLVADSLVDCVKMPENFTEVSKCPKGYLLADGTTLNIKEYPALFKAIGQTYGYDSSKQYTTFKLPDMRDAFIRGIGGENAAAVGTKQDSDNKAHTHILRTISGSGSSSYNIDQSAGNGIAYSSDHVGSSGGAEARPINYAMYVYIKY